MRCASSLRVACACAPHKIARQSPAAAARCRAVAADRPSRLPPPFAPYRPSNHKLTSPLGAQKPDRACAYRTNARWHAARAIANRSSALRARLQPYVMLLKANSSTCPNDTIFPASTMH
uniref:Uncharacterized protein n=1 Tax=Plectus sambesii TaxID=2011161 RepID=A0A914WRY9_9BILA